MAEKVMKKLKKCKYCDMFLSLVKKPIFTIKNQIKVFEDIKVSGIYLVIVSTLAMIIGLIRGIFNTVRMPVNTGTWLSPEITYEWDFSLMSEVPWVDLIIRNFFIYVGVIAGIALVYFLAGLIIKKDPKYPRVLAVATTAFIPYILIILVVVPLLSLLHVNIGVVVSFFTLIYVVALLVGGMNIELDLKDEDVKLFLHTIVITVILSAAYFILLSLENNILTGLI